jgi:hypothetical protein
MGLFIRKNVGFTREKWRNLTMVSPGKKKFIAHTPISFGVLKSLCKVSGFFLQQTLKSKHKTKS